jgi:hypothetical protein
MGPGGATEGRAAPTSTASASDRVRRGLSLNRGSLAEMDACRPFFAG